MNPFLVVSYKPRVEFWFRSDHEGTSSEQFRIGVFDDPDKAAEHIARLDYRQTADPRDDSYSHRIVSITDFEKLIGSVWDEVSDIPYSDEMDGIIALAGQKFKQVAEEAAAKQAEREAEEAAEKLREDQEKAARKHADQERRDAEEYERLKKKFESA